MELSHQSFHLLRQQRPAFHFSPSPSTFELNLCSFPFLPSWNNWLKQNRLADPFSVSSFFLASYFAEVVSFTPFSVTNTNWPAFCGFGACITNSCLETSRIENLKSTQSFVTKWCCFWNQKAHSQQGMSLRRSSTHFERQACAARYKKSAQRNSLTWPWVNEPAHKKKARPHHKKVSLTTTTTCVK